ncbi:MAG: amidohydrolase [Sphingomonadales bacterium]|jgi:imidazolonepropionase-like amidohydrolase
MKPYTLIKTSLALALLAGCAAEGVTSTPAVSGSAAEPEMAASTPFPSTYTPGPSETALLRGATVFDGKGGQIKNGSVLIQDGKIVAVGQDIAAPQGAKIIDASGKWVTPGIIDVHSHLGVYPSPGVSPHNDGNEATDPVTADVWAEHSVWPQDPGFGRALAGGVTAMQILPGSANLVGGRSVTVKNVSSRTVQGMKFPGAPYGMKMACGENPKRVYKSRGPSTRMGNFAGYREAWIKAQGYKESWDEYEQKVADGKSDAKPPKRDLELETLAGVLSGDIIVHMHCYRGDEMAQVLDMAKEFNYKVGTFHHAVESYKIADLLREEGVCSAMWADWWGFKMESYDGIRENIPFVHKAGACAIVHSDSEIGIQHLNQEAAKALSDGQKAGVNISKAEAWTWLSYNPAKALGVEDQTGSLEPGKMADVVLWDGDPFSVYTRAELVYVDGALLYDRNDPKHKPLSDFELGQVGRGDVK